MPGHDRKHGLVHLVPAGEEVGPVGAEGLARIAADHKLADLRVVADAVIAQTERSIRAGIAALPDGSFTKSLPFEIGGSAEPGRIQLTLRIEGDRLGADFTGTSPQVRRPVNSPINYTRAGRFRHDPAVDVPPLPDLEPAARLASLEPGSEAHRVTVIHLTRGRNRVRSGLRAARQVLAEAGA